MEAGLFFPLTQQEQARVVEAIREAGHQDTPEGRRSWLLSRVAAPSNLGAQAANVGKLAVAFLQKNPSILSEILRPK